MNVVTKATSRRRGVAKTVRAAQKTPLPGDAVTETIPDTSAPTDNLDSMGLPELRQLARAQGWSTLTKSGKAAIVKALRENPGGPPAQAQAGAQPEQEATKPAKPAQAEKPQVDAKRAGEIGTRMVELRREYTRGVLAEAADTTPSVVWRWEQGRPKVDELPAVEALLAKVAAGALAKPERKVFGQVQAGPSKAQLIEAMRGVQRLLAEAPVTGKTAQLRGVIDTALDRIEGALSGKPVDADADAN